MSSTYFSDIKGRKKKKERLWFTYAYFLVKREMKAFEGSSPYVQQASAILPAGLWAAEQKRKGLWL